MVVGVAAGVVTTIVTDRLLRRLLPLAVLLRLSLDFPDRAPSRRRMAIARGAAVSSGVEGASQALRGDFDLSSMVVNTALGGAGAPDGPRVATHQRPIVIGKPCATG